MQEDADKLSAGILSGAAVLGYILGELDGYRSARYFLRMKLWLGADSSTYGCSTKNLTSAVSVLAGSYRA